MNFRECKARMDWYVPSGYRGDDYRKNLRAARSWADLHALLSFASPTPWGLVQLIGEKL